MNSVTSRLSMSEVTTLNWAFEEDVEGYAAHGWQGIEVWLHKLMPPGRRYDAMPSDPVPDTVIAEAADLIRRHDLSVSGVVLSGGYTDPDPRARQCQVEHTIWSLGACRTLGTDCLLIVPGPAGKLSRQETSRCTLECLRAVIPAARDLGVRLALEPLHPRHCDYLNTIGEALDLLEGLDSDMCGVFIDTYQVWDTRHVLDDISRAGGRIFGVHLADAPALPRSLEDRYLPGEGELPLRAMVDAIEHTGYRGPYAIELMSPALWMSDYGDLLDRCAQAAGEFLT